MVRRGIRIAEVEDWVGTQSKDLLRIFVREAKQKVQKVYCPCKERVRFSRAYSKMVLRGIRIAEVEDWVGTQSKDLLEI